eukprot:CAMPEP_0179453988 /NCGR_PEP_ID=MMETSP0799-20121207/37858_1 /TAXON_ID=46947 /ORGANISM="Geminigera cryophila, Strain CCMP2564" /LENGTH=228 /DNA_ID=CAMNT_0021251429 /DNA_START=234 /DNA_END=916 /DNA_ORIENTATION=-
MTWFDRDLPDVGVVAKWNAKELDELLFRLSRWDLFSGPGEWREFVTNQIRPLEISEKATFRFLEAGVGVGAFAREILRMFENSKGRGFDTVHNAVEIATVVLPRDRMNVTVGEMTRIHEPSRSFDAVFVPGALCYLYSMTQVRMAVSEFARVLKEGGGMCLSMLPSEVSAKGSCSVGIPKSFWREEVTSEPYHLKLVALEEMSGWKLPHSLGRYSVCLRLDLPQVPLA